MFGEPEESGLSDTFLSSGNFLLLQESLISRMKQASVGVLSPPQTYLQIKDGLLRHQEKNKIVPEEIRIFVLSLCYDHALAGHFGASKTTELVLHTFWWPHLEKDCRKYVEACTTCIQNKSNRTKAWGLLKPLPIPDRPLKMISMDFIVELPPSEGCTAIYVVVDWLSKMAYFLHIKGTPSALETAQIFINKIVSLHGIPANIVSDRGGCNSHQDFGNFSQRPYKLNYPSLQPITPKLTVKRKGPTRPWSNIYVVFLLFLRMTGYHYFH